MKVNTTISIISLLLLCSAVASAEINRTPARGGFSRRSTTVEKERPKLNEETRRLIAEYRRNPTQENYAKLRKQVEANYDRVIARKKAKLEELRREARHSSIVEEMEEIVDEVIRDRERRIEQSMRRFTDERLRPGVRENKDGFLPVIGAKTRISIAYTPVTNAEYAQFVRSTGSKIPSHWEDGTYPRELSDHPVVNISYRDAQSYCKWLSSEQGISYRLPTAEEWEYAAGHMPKDADFNCGVGDATTSVSSYASTLSACGSIDMWGNCWEWTATKGKSGQLVKGGSFKSSRMSCRTEPRDNARKASKQYEDVGFRIIREDK